MQILIIIFTIVAFIANVAVIYFAITARMMHQRFMASTLTGKVMKDGER